MIKLIFLVAIAASLFFVIGFVAGYFLAKKSLLKIFLK